MIDVSRIEYDLVVITPQGQVYHLYDVTRDLVWEELPEELAVRLRATVDNRRVGNKWLHQLLPLGTHIRLYANWGPGLREVFRGMIFATELNSYPRSNVTITAYDMLYQLSRSRDDRYYKSGTTAKTIIKDIAAAWRLPIGIIDIPNIALGKQVFRSMSVAEMIRETLEQVRRRSGGRYFVRASEGKINVIKGGLNKTVYHFDSENVNRVEFEQHIENLVTRVKIIGSESKNDRRPVIARVDGRTEFGIFQELVYKSKNDKPATVMEEARQIIAERGKPQQIRRVEAPDLPFLRRGEKVHIVAESLNGYYLITGITHDATNRTMIMEVEPVA